jgi:hypothetical protein
LSLKLTGSSSMERRNQEHKKIILLGFITCEAFNFKAFSRRVLCYDPRGAYIGLNVYDMTSRGAYMEIMYL